MQDVSPPEYGAVLHHLGLAASYYYSDNRRAARLGSTQYSRYTTTSEYRREARSDSTQFSIVHHNSFRMKEGSKVRQYTVQ